MCRNPLPIKLAKITVIVIFFCFAECAAGSCLSYGHACWGAHGKRDGSRTSPTNQETQDTQWFLSRLIQNPIDLRYMSGIPTNQEQQLLTDAQIDSLKSQEYIFRNNLDDSYPNEINVDDFYQSHPRSHSNRLKASQRLNKRSTTV